MIALDTNVLVRLLVCDDEAQAARAKDLVNTQVEKGSALLGNTTLRLESPTVVDEALIMYESGAADFADCFIVAKARMTGCEETVTFDRRMQRLPSVRLL